MSDYWLVRAKWGGSDKTVEFIQNDVWVNGYNNKYLNIVKRVKENDVLILANGSLINYYATCLTNEGDGKRIIVDGWKKFKTAITFLSKGAYIKTIVKIHHKKLKKDVKSAIKQLKILQSLSINAIKLRNFTQFKDNNLKFSQGINVIIGENSTSKTQLMKVMYALLSSNNSIAEFDTENIKYALQTTLADKLKKILKPDQLANLITKGEESSYVCLDLDKYQLEFELQKKVENAVDIKKESVVKKLYAKKAVYIPAKEMLSFFDGFISIYPATSFDETFRDLANHLGALVPNNIHLHRFEQAILDQLEKLLEGKIILRSGRFYLETKQEITEITLVAEGLRKLGTLFHLIANGTLDKDSILFWDEPEENLNPNKIKIMVDLLISLAQHGIQIFIATHSYFMLKYFDLRKKEKDDVALQFISLFKTKNGLESEIATDIYDLENNTIMDEIEHVYLAGSKLFHRDSR